MEGLWLEWRVMDGMDAFIQQLSWQRPGPWLVLSLVLGGGIARWVAVEHRARRWWIGGYQVLVPYAALLVGAVSPRLMGLTGIDWRVTLVQGLWVALLLLGFTVLVRMAWQRGMAIFPETSPREDPPGGSHRFLGAVAQEFHWCFLRGGLAEIGMGIAVGPPLYLATWLAVGLALPELLGRERSAMGRLAGGTVLLLTSVLFLYTRNFWLGALVHWAARSLLSWGSGGRSKGPISPHRA